MLSCTESQAARAGANAARRRLMSHLTPSGRVHAARLRGLHCYHMHACAAPPKRLPGRALPLRWCAAPQEVLLKGGRDRGSPAHVVGMVRQAETVEVANFLIDRMGHGVLTAELLQPDELVSGIIAQASHRLAGSAPQSANAHSHPHAQASILKLVCMTFKQELASRLQYMIVLTGVLQRATSLRRSLLSPRWQVCFLGSYTPVKVSSTDPSRYNACWIMACIKSPCYCHSAHVTVTALWHTHQTLVCSSASPKQHQHSAAVHACVNTCEAAHFRRRRSVVCRPGDLSAAPHPVCAA